jgi:ankyrin repeat protein
VTEAQCDPNIRNKDEETPIHTACLSGHVDMVKYLVNEAHCDPNPQSNNGETPLHTAGRSAEGWGKL